MTSADLQALRALDLPAPRVAYLSRLILSAPTPDERERIIDEATTESRRNAYRIKAQEDRLYRLRREYEQATASTPQAPSAPRTGSRRYTEMHPEPRPVSVSYTKPTKQAPEPVDESKPVCPPEHPHSDHCYTAHKCRCSQCRAAKAKTQREHRQRKYGFTPAIEREEPRWTIPPNDPRHGTANGYRNLKCRCDRCREAHRVDKLNRRHEAKK